MKRNERLILIITILASGIAMLDGSIVNVALPAMARALGGGLPTQQWVIDGYMLTLSALILSAGALSDSLGRKRILVVGLIGFGVTSLACAIAPDSTTLILARVLQGAAGALLVPSSLAIIIASFPERAAQGKAIGTWTAWTGISFIIGPLLGGILVDSFSWRWIFAINVLPILFTLWLLTNTKLPEDEPDGQRVDWLGTVLCAVGFGLTIYALIEQPVRGWSDPMITAPLIIGIVLLTAFFYHEHSTKNPMLPLSLFKARNFLYGNLATVSIYAGLSASFIVTIFIQQVAGYNALEAGLALIPVTFIMFFLSPRFGALAGKYGPRIFMTIGPLVAAAGFAWLSFATVQATYVTQLLPGVLLFGLGLSITVAPLTAAVLGSIDPRHAGIGSAINNAVARVAGLLAVALIGVVIGTHLNVAGFHNGMLAISTLLLAGSAISAYGIRTPDTKKS
jgi:EmrB/QacA subfamily drug resistance transporter